MYLADIHREKKKILPIYPLQDIVVLSSPRLKETLMTQPQTKPHATVRVIRRFNASPERIFDAWLDPVQAGKWLFATPSGKMVRVEIDARIGGLFTIVERRDGEDVKHTGEYIEMD